MDDCGHRSNTVLKHKHVHVVLMQALPCSALLIV